MNTTASLSSDTYKQITQKDRLYTKHIRFPLHVHCLSRQQHCCDLCKGHSLACIHCKGLQVLNVFTQIDKSNRVGS